MRFSVLIIVFTIFGSLISCSDKQDDCTEIIPKREMVNLVTDVFLLENHISGLRGSAREMDSVIFLYVGLFDHHNISPQKFDKAIKCYFLDKEKMDKMLDEVLITLSISQSQARGTEQSQQESEQESISD